MHQKVYQFFPNPTKARLLIQSDASPFDLKTIRIRDLFGNEVLHIERNILRGTKIKIDIDLNQLADGPYFLILSGDDIWFVEKIIKIE